jgi:hypothetical protein
VKLKGLSFLAYSNSHRALVESSSFRADELYMLCWLARIGELVTLVDYIRTNGQVTPPSIKFARTVATIGVSNVAVGKAVTANVNSKVALEMTSHSLIGGRILATDTTFAAPNCMRLEGADGSKQVQAAGCQELMIGETSKVVGIQLLSDEVSIHIRIHTAPYPSHTSLPLI